MDRVTELAIIAAMFIVPGLGAFAFVKFTDARKNKSLPPRMRTGEEQG